MKYWQRDQDHFEPAKIMLKEKHEFNCQQEFWVDNYHGLALYIKISTSLLGSRSKELAIDAKYGTISRDANSLLYLPNSMGLELYWHTSLLRNLCLQDEIISYARKNDSITCSVSPTTTQSRVQSIFLKV